MSVHSVTVIIPVRDRPGPLAQLLGSIKESIDNAVAQRATPGVEVIVVDDRSVCTLSVPAGLDGRIVRADGFGPGAARNTGARAAAADWLLFTDSDCTVDREWVRAACDHLAGPEKLVVQGDPTCYTRSTQLGALEEALYGHMYSTYVAEDRRHTSMLDSRNLLIRRDALLEVGGFDTSGRDAMAESRTLASRLLKAGFTFNYAENMVVRHEAPHAVEVEMSTKFRHGRGRVGIWGAEPPSDADLALRYFIRPMREGIDPAYVLPVHLAFLGGYSHEMCAGSAEVPTRVLQHVPEAETCAPLTQVAFDWLAERSSP